MEINREFQQYFAEMYNKQQKHFSEGDCLHLAMEIAERIKSIGHSVQIKNFMTIDKKYFSPKYNPDIHFGSHYAAISNNLVFDPLFEEPKNLDWYVNSGFTSKLKINENMTLKI